MACSELLPTCTPLDARTHDVDVEIFVRHLLGHRRITSDLVDALAPTIGTNHFHDTTWMCDLLEAGKLPFVDVGYDVLAGAPAGEGPPRWAIAPAVLEEIDRWFEAGDPLHPIGDSDGPRKTMLLVLWGHGCGIGEHTRWRGSTQRIVALTEAMPDLPLVVDALVDTNRPGMTRDELIATLTVLQKSGAVGVLGIDFTVVTSQRVAQWIRHAHDAGLLRPVRPAPTKSVSTIARLEQSGIAELRRSIRAARISVGSRAFALDQLGRAVQRKRIGLTRPSTPQGAAEVDSLVQVHRVIGSLVSRHHPSCVDRSASLYPIRRVPVYAAAHYRAGHPSGVAHIGPDGAPNPKVRLATRTPDGAVWFAGDRHDQPSVLIEYEASPGNLRLESHIETALWLASTWGKPLTLVVVTSKRSHEAVVRDLTSFFLDDIARRFAADWPDANVDVRVVRESTLIDECPLHGDAADSVRLRSSQHILRSAT